MRMLRLLPCALLLCALAACDAGNVTGAQPAPAPSRDEEQAAPPTSAGFEGNGTLGSGN